MISAINITKSYGGGESHQQVLRGIDLTVSDGDFVVILGVSGSGKTTLLNVLSGLERPDGGKVFHGEKEITGLTDTELTEFRRDEVGFIFQQYYLLPNLSVERNVRMGADLVGNREYLNIIAAVGLSDKKNAFPGELSGGEQQRAALPSLW